MKNRYRLLLRAMSVRRVNNNFRNDLIYFAISTGSVHMFGIYQK